MDKYNKEFFELDKKKQKNRLDELKTRRKVIKSKINKCYDKKMFALAIITSILGGTFIGVGKANINEPMGDLYIISGSFCFLISLLDAYLAKRCDKESTLKDLKKQKEEIEKLIEEEKNNEIIKRRVLKK